MEEKIVNGELVVVENAEEGEFIIDASPGLAEALGFDDPEPEDA